MDYYKLRFQIEFTFRDAKQHFGLEDFMGVGETSVANGLGLSFFVGNVARYLLEDFRERCPGAGLSDLKSFYRGRHYLRRVLKMLPDRPDGIVCARLLEQMNANSAAFMGTLARLLSWKWRRKPLPLGVLLIWNQDQMAHVRASGLAKVLSMIHADLTQAIIGCAMKVHRALGPGFLESVYQNALAYELRQAGFATECEKKIQVFYAGVVVGDFVADMLVEGIVIIENKAVRTLDLSHELQLVNYLTATGIDIGILFNFGARSLETRRKFRTFRPKQEVTKQASQDSEEDHG